MNAVSPIRPGGEAIWIPSAAFPSNSRQGAAATSFDDSASTLDTVLPPYQPMRKASILDHTESSTSTGDSLDVAPFRPCRKASLSIEDMVSRRQGRPSFIKGSSIPNLSAPSSSTRGRIKEAAAIAALIVHADCAPNLPHRKVSLLYHEGE